MTNNPSAPASPTPWTIKQNTRGVVRIEDANGELVVVKMHSSETVPHWTNADRIVEAVNTHATLQAEAADLRAWKAAHDGCVQQATDDLVRIHDEIEARRDGLEEQVETLTTQLAERSRQRKAAVAALRRLEFTKVIVGADTCPACGWGKPHGHSKSHCWLRDVLESGEGAVTPKENV